MQRANISIEEALVTVISTLLSGFPASATTDKGAQLRAYMMAIDGIPFEAIERAATAYIRGGVADHNSDFAPSCASFAAQCKYQQLVIEAAARPRIEIQAPPVTKPVDPRKLKLLNAALQGDPEATAELKRMYPDLPVWRMADLPVSKLMESE